MNSNINYDDYVLNRFKSDEEFLKSCVKSAFMEYEKDQDIAALVDTLKQALEAISKINPSNPKYL